MGGVNFVTVELPHQNAAETKSEQLKNPDLEKMLRGCETPEDDSVSKWIGRGCIVIVPMVKFKIKICRKFVPARSK